MKKYKEYKIYMRNVWKKIKNIKNNYKIHKLE